MITTKLSRGSLVFRSLMIATVAVMLTASSNGCTSSAKSGAGAKRPHQLADEGDARFAAGADQKPNARTLSAMAKLLTAKGRDRDAVNLLNQTIRQFPDYVPAHNELAGIYLRSDRPGDAIDVLSAALKRAPKDPVLLNNLGLCYFLQADYERALAAFTRAAVAVPDNGLYRANEAAALGMLGRDTEAARRYDGVVRDASIEHNLDVLRRARAPKTTAAPTDQTAQQHTADVPQVRS